MRLLILGGTAQLGRAVALEALRRGDEVVCLARGESGGVPDGARLVRGDRDTPHALDGVADQQWDAVVDVSRQPGQVREAAGRLKADHWVFVSTISVYADASARGMDESAAVLEPLAAASMEGPEDYGPAKVACELAVRERVGADRAAIVRAGLIGGHDDDSDRSTYWPWRMANPADRGGRVLVPDAPDQPVQLLDVRDLAEFVVRCAFERVAGTFDAAGERTSFGDLLMIAQEVAGGPRELVRAAPQWLVEQGVSPWTGPRSLPLWLPEEAVGLMDRRSVAASSVGLSTRPYAEQLASALAYARGRGPGHAWSSGLTDEQERELLSQLL